MSVLSEDGRQFIILSDDESKTTLQETTGTVVSINEASTRILKEVASDTVVVDSTKLIISDGNQGISGPAGNNGAGVPQVKLSALAPSVLHNVDVFPKNDFATIKYLISILDSGDSKYMHTEVMCIVQGANLVRGIQMMHGGDIIPYDMNFIIDALNVTFQFTHTAVNDVDFSFTKIEQIT